MIPGAGHDHQAKPIGSCSCSAASSNAVVSTASSATTSTDSGKGSIGPCGVPNRVENICLWHSSQKQKYEKCPSSRSLWTVAPGTILRTNSVADGGTTRSSIPCYRKEWNSVLQEPTRTNKDAEHIVWGRIGFIKQYIGYTSSLLRPMTSACANFRVTVSVY